MISCRVPQTKYRVAHSLNAQAISQFWIGKVYNLVKYRGKSPCIRVSLVQTRMKAYNMMRYKSR